MKPALSVNAPRDNRPLKAGLYKRMGIFAGNVGWLSQIAGGSAKAAFYLLFLKTFRRTAVPGRLGQFRFLFRYCDYSSLREMLILKEYDFLKEEVSSGTIKTIVDCGGHIGLSMLWLLQYNRHLKIVSVEASADNYKILQKNSVKSGADWTVLNRACWKNDDLISLSQSSDSMSNHVSEDGGNTVQGITLYALSDYFGGEADLLKVDIEGAEEAFLANDPALLKKIKRVVIEMHPRYCDAAAVERVLDGNFPNKRVISGRDSKNPVIYYSR